MWRIDSAQTSTAIVMCPAISILVAQKWLGAQMSRRRRRLRRCCCRCFGRAQQGECHAAHWWTRPGPVSQAASRHPLQVSDCNATCFACSQTDSTIVHIHLHHPVDVTRHTCLTTAWQAGAATGQQSRLWCTLLVHADLSDGERLHCAACVLCLFQVDRSAPQVLPCAHCADGRHHQHL